MRVTVGKLKEMLSQYPDDMPVIYRFCSDYEALESDDLRVIEAVDQGGYVMKAHPTMSADNKSRMRQMLLFPGN